MSDLPSLSLLSLRSAPTATRKGKEKASAPAPAPAPAPATEPEPAVPNWFRILPQDLQDVLLTPYLIDQIGDLETTEQLSVEDLCKILGSFCNDPIGRAHPMCTDPDHKGWRAACAYLGMFVKFTNAQGGPMSWRATFNQMCDMMYWLSIANWEYQLMARFRFFVVGLRRGTLPGTVPQLPEGMDETQISPEFRDEFNTMMALIQQLIQSNWGLRQLLEQVESFLNEYENAVQFSTQRILGRAPLEWVERMREYLAQWPLAPTTPENSNENSRWRCRSMMEKLGWLVRSTGEEGSEASNVRAQLLVNLVRHAIVAGVNLTVLGNALADSQLFMEFPEAAAESLMLLLNAGMTIEFITIVGLSSIDHGYTWEDNDPRMDEVYLWLEHAWWAAGVLELMTRLFEMGARASNVDFLRMRRVIRQIVDGDHRPTRIEQPVPLEELVALVKAMNLQGMDDLGLQQALEVSLFEAENDGGAGPSGVNHDEDDAEEEDGE